MHVIYLMLCLLKAHRINTNYMFMFLSTEYGRYNTNHMTPESIWKLLFD